MKISNPTGNPDCRKPQYTVRFEQREVEQIRYPYPQRSFEKVPAVSEWNEMVYQNTIRPWVTALSSPLSAEALKWLHPMWSSALIYSEKFNPWMWPLRLFAPLLAPQRMPATQDNPFAAMKAHTSKLISLSLDNYRSARDAASERLFSLLYGTH